MKLIAKLNHNRTKLNHNRTLRSARSQFPFYLMMSPGLLFIAVMCYIPMGGIIIAFKDYNARDGILGSAWMDPLFKNFEFFFKSEAARIVTFNTLLYNIIEMVTVTLGALLLAILLSEIKNKFLSVTYKGSILLPVFLSWIVVQYIVFGMLSVDRGIVNNMITSNGGEAVQWYSEPSYWRFILPFAYLWKNIGYYSVLYVAAIAGINTDYYEASQLDGASKWQQVKYITLPLLKPIIIVLCLLWVGKLFNGGLGDWNGFYTIANDSGALYASTDVIDTLVFRSLKKLNDYGMSSAIGLYQAVVGFVLVLISNYIIKKTDPDSALF